MEIVAGSSEEELDPPHPRALSNVPNTSATIAISKDDRTGVRTAGSAV
jgi:hypothetical protein